MRKNVKRLLGLLAVVAILSVSVLLACKKTYVEEYYSGRVVGVEMCNTRTNGYLIELDSPKGVGDTMTLGNKFYKNLVIGYEAPTRLKDNQKISGVMYQTMGYANINCMFANTRSLQEVIILTVDEE
ncbi:MAG: hypothetical protein IKD33_00180 [Bacteroidales bacterium]|nr:hypothetical protein [Bacteroidales bacterium]